MTDHSAPVIRSEVVLGPMSSNRHGRAQRSIFAGCSVLGALALPGFVPLLPEIKGVRA